MAYLRAEYPCGHTFELKTGLFFDGSINYDFAEGCPIHGKKCVAPTQPGKKK